MRLMFDEDAYPGGLDLGEAKGLWLGMWAVGFYQGRLWLGDKWIGKVELSVNLSTWLVYLTYLFLAAFRYVCDAVR